MKEFDYSLDYKSLDFTKPEVRRLYRIGRGEQGVLLVRPYTNLICRHWRFKTPEIAEVSARTIYSLFLSYIGENDFIGADMARKFLEMGYTRSRRYANHRSGRKYNADRSIKPQEADHASCSFAESARIFHGYRTKAAKHPDYVKMRKTWREDE